MKIKHDISKNLSLGAINFINIANSIKINTIYKDGVNSHPHLYIINSPEAYFL